MLTAADIQTRNFPQAIFQNSCELRELLLCGCMQLVCCSARHAPLITCCMMAVCASCPACQRRLVVCCTLIVLQLR